MSCIAMFSGSVSIPNEELPSENRSGLFSAPNSDCVSAERIMPTLFPMLYDVNYSLRMTDRKKS